MLNSYVMLMAQGGVAQAEMTTAGWVFLGTSWGAIIFVTVWTFSKILRGK